MSMSFSELWRTCRIVRIAGQNVYDAGLIPHYSIAPFPRGWCGCLSRVLGAVLIKKFPNESFAYVSGEEYFDNVRFQSHAWIESNNLIIDITADQFDGIDKEIIIVDKQSSQFHARYQVVDRHAVALNVESDYEERIIMREVRNVEIEGTRFDALSLPENYLG